MRRPSAINSDRFFTTDKWAIAVGSEGVEPFDRIAWEEEGFAIHADSAVPQRFGVSFGNIGRFEVDFARKAIKGADLASVSAETVSHIIDDQIFPRILAHDGKLVLHAAGVKSGEGMIVLMGLSGAGKSSLAASFHEAGSPLLGDDAIVVATSDGRATGRAVYPSLRLYADSVAALVDELAHVEQVASYTTKRNVVYPDYREPTEPLQISAAFLLDCARGEEITVEPMSASEACMTFVEHSFWMDPTDIARTKQRMVKASELAARVPAFRLAYPRDYSALPAVRDSIAAVLG